MLQVPIVRVLFEGGRFGPADTAATAGALATLAIGLFFFAGIRVIVPAFYALKNTTLPVAAAAADAVTFLLLCLVLSRPFGPSRHRARRLDLGGRQRDLSPDGAAPAGGAPAGPSNRSVARPRGRRLGSDGRSSPAGSPRSFPRIGIAGWSGAVLLAALIGGAGLFYGLAAHLLGAPEPRSSGAWRGGDRDEAGRPARLERERPGRRRRHRRDRARIPGAPGSRSRRDTAADAEEAARKVAGLRVFEDADGKMNLSLADVGGSALVVSQFTLAADLSRGRRPGFERALPGREAEPLYERFVSALAAQGVPVATGVFGATMQVALVNEGPATFLLELKARGTAAEPPYGLWIGFSEKHTRNTATHRKATSSLPKSRVAASSSTGGCTSPIRRTTAPGNTIQTGRARGDPGDDAQPEHHARTRSAAAARRPRAGRGPRRAGRGAGDSESVTKQAEPGRHERRMLVDRRARVRLDPDPPLRPLHDQRVVEEPGPGSQGSRRGPRVSRAVQEKRQRRDEPGERARRADVQQDALRSDRLLDADQRAEGSGENEQEAATE